MEKKSGLLIVIIVILALLLGLLGGYIITQKLVSKDNDTNDTNDSKIVTYKGVEFSVINIEKDLENESTSDTEFINIVLKIENKSSSDFDEFFRWEWVNSKGESIYDGMFQYPHELSIQTSLKKIKPGDSITGVVQVAKPKNEKIVKIKAISTLADGPKDAFEIVVSK